MLRDVLFEDLHRIDELDKVSNRVQSFLTENIGSFPATKISFSLNSKFRVRRTSLLNVLFLALLSKFQSRTSILALNVVPDSATPFVEVQEASRRGLAPSLLRYNS
jgi:hypothetical protein